MALAIMLLLVFEALVGALTFAEGVDWAWCIPIGVFALYLVVINVALWPPRDEVAN